MPIDRYTVQVAHEDVAAVVANLPAELQGPDSDLVYRYDPENENKGTLSVNVAHKASLDNVLAMTAGQRNQTVLRSYAADVRWRKQTGGITAGGYRVSTTQESLGAIATAVRNVQQNKSLVSIPFKTLDGWVTMESGTVARLQSSIDRYYQSCIAAEAAVDVKIGSSTYTSMDQVDAASEWPSDTVALDE